MSASLGQTWIAGTKNGVPMLFNIHTGATKPLPQTHNKRRRAAPLRKSPPPPVTNRWIAGQKDGHTCYFDTQTGACREGPQSTLDTSLHMIPFATAVPAISDTSMQLDDAFDDVDESFFKGIGSDLDLSKSLEDLSGFDASSAFDVPVPTPENYLHTAPRATTKSELRKMRNREHASKSRVRRLEKTSQLTSTISNLEAQVAQLQKALAVSNAENGSLKDQVTFLQSLVSTVMQKRT